MAELTPQERLQPALLDRLTDEHPDEQQEAREQRVMSKRQLRQAVLRDLAWLFNATRLESGVDLSKVPEVRRSVLNFGLPALLFGAELRPAGLQKILAHGARTETGGRLLALHFLLEEIQVCEQGRAGIRGEETADFVFQTNAFTAEFHHRAFEILVEQKLPSATF